MKRIIDLIKSTAKKLKREIPVLYLAMKDPGTPYLAKFLTIITVGYALSPIDLIPDFIPILGYLDDIIILPILVYLTLKLLPNEVISNCRSQMEDSSKENFTKKWYYAIPIVLIWGCLLTLLVIKFIG